MARPKKEGMDYFPHDTDASNDEKIEALRSLFGNDGYAFYFIILERVYRTKSAELDVSKPVLFASLAGKLLVSQDKLREMLEASFDLELLDREAFENDGKITSYGIKKRFEEVENIRNKWRKRKEKQECSEVFQGENGGENEGVTQQSKVKESKVKESKDNISRPKRTNHVYDEDSIPYRSAKYLLTKIREFKPDFKEPDLQKWADHMRKLIEIDKRDPKEIARVIDWVTQDDFWKTNILSAETLRRQWDKVTVKMQSGKKPTYRSSPAAPHLELVKPTKEEEEILAKAYQQQLLRNQAKRA